MFKIHFTMFILLNIALNNIVLNCYRKHV